MRRFVFLPPATFESRLQRPQSLAIELAKLCHFVYFPSSNKVNETPIHSQYGVHFFYSQLEVTDINKQLVMYDQLLEKELDQQDVIVVMHPNWQIDEKCKAHIHYDLMDRWWEFDNSDKCLCSIRNQYWLSRADSVSVSSSILLTEVVNRSDARVIWNASFPIIHSELPAGAGTNKIRFVYIGAISHWIDFDSMNRVAKLVNRFKGELVIVGQIEDPRICSLLAYKSVSFTGELDHNEAMLQLQTATAGLIPFLRTSLTEAVDPVKVYEYLEHGLFVLGTNFGPYNPKIKSKVSEISTWRIILIFICSYLKLIMKKTTKTSRLDPSNLWNYRAYELLETIGPE